MFDADVIQSAPGAPPAYRQLADAIRAKIAAGELLTGDALPSEKSLAEQVGISRPTVVKALDLLAEEGLLVRSHGRATSVRAKPPQQVIEPLRYQAELDEARRLRDDPEAATDAFPSADEGREWDVGSHSFVKLAEMETVDSADSACRHLQVTKGTPLVRRVFIRYAHATPVQIRISYIPRTLMLDSALLQPENQPWPGGTMSELVHLRIAVTAVEESLRSRRPTRWEADTLTMARSANVWEMTRVFIAGVKPVETSELISESTGTTIRWRVDVR